MKHASPPDSPLLFPVPVGPDYEIEKSCHARGKLFVAGTDEVGRGPLAGPVVAASVILDPQNIPDGLNDSKKLTAKRRETLFVEILQSSTVAISSVAAEVIDQINIRAATLLAMRNSLFGLAIVPDMALIDGRDCPPGLTFETKAIIKGDARCLSIAAASIVAKVTRDRMMEKAGRVFPAYGFEGHKGYGSKAHMAAIATNGPCPIHRMSFSPMRHIKD
jgi:ribonuclease HII